MIKEIYEDIKAALRGEVRTHPMKVTGRVFRNKDEKLEEEKSSPYKSSIGQGELTISARVIRADGSVEDLGKIS